MFLSKQKFLSLLLSASMIPVVSYGETLGEKKEEEVSQEPKLKISGYTIFNAYQVNQSPKGVAGDARPNGFDSKNHASIDKTDLVFEVTGKSATDITYKYKLLLRAMPSSSSIVKNNYIEVGGKFGSVQLGNLSGPEEAMKHDTASIIGGAGGFDGVWTNAFIPAAGVITGNSVIGGTGDATKLVYYTPNLNGFKFGLAWTPDTSHLGGSGMKTDGLSAKDFGNNNLYYNKGVKPWGQNNFTLGMDYRMDNDDWGFEFGAALVLDQSYVSGTNKKTESYALKVEGTRSYQLGSVLKYKNFKFSAGWIDNGKSRLLKDINKLPAETVAKLVNNSVFSGTQPYTVYNFDGGVNVANEIHLGDSGKMWNIGAQYSHDIYKFGLSYQSSRRKLDNLKSLAKADIISVTATADPFSGLRAYVEIDFINSCHTGGDTMEKRLDSIGGTSTTADPVAKNRGAVFIIGSKLTF